MNLLHFLKAPIEQWLRTRALVLPAADKAKISSTVLASLGKLPIPPDALPVVEAFAAEAVAQAIDQTQARVEAIAVAAIEKI